MPLLALIALMAITITSIIIIKNNMNWIIAILSVQGFCLYCKQINMLEKGSKFKTSEIIPSIGRYKCLVCGLIIEIEQKFIDMGSTFFTCPICHAGEEGSAKGAQDRVWEFLG